MKKIAILLLALCIANCARDCTNLPAYNSANNYLKNERVITDDGKVYRAKQDTEDQPEEGPFPGDKLITNTDYWLLLGNCGGTPCDLVQGWDKTSQSYQNGALVEKDGVIYRRTWNDPSDCSPPDENNNVWVEVDTCYITCENAPSWQSKLYRVNDIVFHAGKLWRAKYWTGYDAPTSDPWGPWQKLITCGQCGTCARNAPQDWTFLVRYRNSNDVISKTAGVQNIGGSGCLKNLLYFDGGNGNGIIDGASDPNGEYLELKDVDIGGDLSFTFWARWDSFNYWSRIVDFGNGQNAQNILIANELNTNNLVYEHFVPTTRYRFQLNNYLVAGELHHYAITVRNNNDNTVTVRFYRDGAFVSQPGPSYVESGVGNVPTVQRNFRYVARSNWYWDEFFRGSIGDLRIFERVLTDAEVANIACVQD